MNLSKKSLAFCGVAIVCIAGLGAAGSRYLSEQNKQALTQAEADLVAAKAKERAVLELHDGQSKSVAEICGISTGSENAVIHKILAGRADEVLDRTLESLTDPTWTTERKTFEAHRDARAIAIQQLEIQPRTTETVHGMNQLTDANTKEMLALWFRSGDIEQAKVQADLVLRFLRLGKRVATQRENIEARVRAVAPFLTPATGNNALAQISQSWKGACSNIENKCKLPISEAVMVELERTEPSRLENDLSSVMVAVKDEAERGRAAYQAEESQRQGAALLGALFNAAAQQEAQQRQNQPTWGQQWAPR